MSRVQWEIYDIEKEYINNHPNLRHHVFISKETTRVLSSYVIEEPWGHDQNMLYKYLDYIWRCQLFDRQVKKFTFIKKEDNTQQTRLTFHTGLQKRDNGEFIFLLLTPNDADKRNVEQKWRVPMVCQNNLDEWFVSKQYFLSIGSDIADIPQRTQFYNSLEELVFNPDFDIDVDWNERLKTNKDRIYEKLRMNGQKVTEKMLDLTQLSLIFKTSCHRSLNIARGNPRWVAPQAFVDSGKKRHRLELLLPLFITLDEGKSSDVFALALQPSKNKYTGMSILTAEMAYANGRLVGFIDSRWLANVITNEDILHSSYGTAEEKIKTGDDHNNELPLLSLHSFNNSNIMANENINTAQEIKNSTMTSVVPGHTTTTNIVPMPLIISASTTNGALPTTNSNNLVPIPHIITVNSTQTSLPSTTINNNVNNQFMPLSAQQQQITNVNNRDIPSQCVSSIQTNNCNPQSFERKFNDTMNSYSPTMSHGARDYQYHALYTTCPYNHEEQQALSTMYMFPTAANNSTNDFPTSNSAFLSQPKLDNIHSLDTNKGIDRINYNVPTNMIPNSFNGHVINGIPVNGNATIQSVPSSIDFDHQNSSYLSLDTMRNFTSSRNDKLEQPQASEMHSNLNINNKEQVQNISATSNFNVFPISEITPNSQMEIMPVNELNSAFTQPITTCPMTNLFLSQLPVTPPLHNATFDATPNSISLNFPNLIKGNSDTNFDMDLLSARSQIEQDSLSQSIDRKLSALQDLHHENITYNVDVVMSKSWNEQKLRCLLQDLEIKNVIISPLTNIAKNYDENLQQKAIIQMKYPQDAILVKNRIINKKYGTNIEVINIPLPPTLRVSNLSSDSHIEALKQIFNEFGMIISIYFIHSDKVAFIQYATNDSITSALNRFKMHDQWKVGQVDECVYSFFNCSCNVWQFQVGREWQFHPAKMSLQIDGTPINQTIQFTIGNHQYSVIRYDVDFGKQINLVTKKERLVRRLNIEVWKKENISTSYRFGELSDLAENQSQQTMLMSMSPSHQHQSLQATIQEPNAIFSNSMSAPMNTVTQQPPLTLKSSHSQQLPISTMQQEQNSSANATTATKYKRRITYNNNMTNNKLIPVSNFDNRHKVEGFTSEQSSKQQHSPQQSQQVISLRPTDAISTSAKQPTTQTSEIFRNINSSSDFLNFGDNNIAPTPITIDNSIFHSSNLPQANRSSPYRQTENTVVNGVNNYSDNHSAGHSNEMLSCKLENVNNVSNIPALNNGTNLNYYNNASLRFNNMTSSVLPQQSLKNCNNKLSFNPVMYDQTTQHSIIENEYQKLSNEIGTNAILEIRYCNDGRNFYNAYNQGYIPQIVWYCDNRERARRYENHGFIIEQGCQLVFYAKPRNACILSEVSENEEIDLFKCEILLNDAEYNALINDDCITFYDMSRIHILYIICLYKHSLISQEFIANAQCRIQCVD